jgi:hypothetical protein
MLPVQVAHVCLVVIVRELEIRRAFRVIVTVGALPFMQQRALAVYLGGSP